MQSNNTGWVKSLCVAVSIICDSKVVNVRNVRIVEFLYCIASGQYEKA